MQFAEALIKGTPVYVWVILALLISRAVKATKDSPVSIKRSLLMPAIFIVWGLEKVVIAFAFPIQSLLTYIILLGVGTGVGYLIYSALLKFEVRDGEFIRLGSKVPGVIIIINFIIKYIENVAMAVDTQLLSDLWYNVAYCVISGFTVGLFIGGIINTVKNQKRLLGKAA